MVPAQTTDPEAEAIAEAERATAEASAEQAMKDAGEPTTIPHVEDYFPFEETFGCMLPDGHSYIEHKALTEGDRRTYRNSTSRGLELVRSSGNAHMQMAAGDDLHILLRLAIVGWNLRR